MSRPWIIVGTVPDEDFGLVHGPCVLSQDGPTVGGLAVGGVCVPVRRGTPALLAAACAACAALGLEPPQALLAGFSVRVMGPPPDMRTGCDMVVEFELMREPAARRVLEAANLAPLAVAPVRAGMLEPVSLYQTTDFGQWLMVRAANMKLTVEKESRVIVNISGGGCPDVPALAELLVGRTLHEAQPPLSRGQTLCSYALELAFREAQRQLPGPGPEQP